MHFATWLGFEPSLQHLDSFPGSASFLDSEASFPDIGLLDTGLDTMPIVTVDHTVRKGV